MSALVKRNWNWNQGTDLPLHFVYKVGESTAEAVPPDAFSAWSVRMDLREGSTVVGTINSEVSGTDTFTEATLSDDGSINIVLGRELTLTGHLADRLKSKSVVVDYDIILRNANGTSQIKLAEGQITVDPSITLWP